MAFDTPAVLNAVVTLVQGLTGMQSVTKGVPESLPTRVAAYVTVGPQPENDRTAGGLLRKEGRIRVTFGYRVSGAEATAESDLAAMIDRFMVAYYAARRTNLSGTVTSLGNLDHSVANTAEYEAIAGQEYRRYPVDIPFTQEQTY